MASISTIAFGDPLIVVVAGEFPAQGRVGGQLHEDRFGAAVCVAGETRPVAGAARAGRIGEEHDAGERVELAQAVENLIVVGRDVGVQRSGLADDVVRPADDVGLLSSSSPARLACTTVERNQLR